MFSLPGIVLAIVIAGLLGPNRRNAMIAIGIVILPAFARVVRGAVLEVMGYPYTESARALGASGWRIMGRHVIPNIGAPLLVLVTVYLSVAILAEAALSFLGLGTQPPEASWGGMLSTARTYIDITPWLSIFPGVAIMIVVLGFNLLGDGLRDILDPAARPARRRRARPRSRASARRPDPGRLGRGRRRQPAVSRRRRDRGRQDRRRRPARCRRRPPSA